MSGVQDIEAAVRRDQRLSLCAQRREMCGNCRSARKYFLVRKRAGSHRNPFHT
jgi:hypothetical protein